MLLDSINRLYLYEDSIPHLREALAKLAEVRNAEPGRYEYDGKNYRKAVVKVAVE